MTIGVLDVLALELPALVDRDGNLASFNPSDTEYMAFGACREHDPAFWDTDTHRGKTSLRGTVVIGGRTMRKRDQIATARRICQSCPVLSECAAYVKQYPQSENVWAATLPEERV